MRGKHAGWWRSTGIDVTGLFRHGDVSAMMASGGAGMKHREFICVLVGIVTGFRFRRRTIIAAMAAMALLPIEASDAGRLSHIGKSSSRHDKSSKHVTSPKRHSNCKAAARTLRPGRLEPSALKPVAATCDPSKFRIVLDVGHTAESEGAISARNVAEYVFNLRLARRIEEKLKAEGFAETRLLVDRGQGQAKPLQAGRRRQQSPGGSLPVDPP